jgi:hypothetical protein
MAKRTFDVIDIIEILVHWQAGRNNSEIAQSLGVDRTASGPPGRQPSEPHWTVSLVRVSWGPARRRPLLRRSL